MRTELKTIMWYGKGEEPQKKAATVLVRILKTSDESIKTVRYAIWLWFNTERLQKGFYGIDGNLINDSTYKPVPFKVLDYEWCYLSLADQNDEVMRPIF